MISERIKKLSYKKSLSDCYFWRTKDQMEIDYLEILNSNIDAYEFKFNPNKKTRITKSFTNSYPNAKIKTITSDNYDELLG